MKKVSNTIERLKVLDIVNNLSRENKQALLVQLASDLNVNIETATSSEYDDALNIHKMKKYIDIDFTPELKTKIMETHGVDIKVYASESLILFTDNKGETYFHDLLLGVEGRVDGIEMDETDYNVVNFVLELIDDELDDIISAIKDIEDTIVNDNDVDLI